MEQIQNSYRVSPQTVRGVMCLFQREKLPIPLDLVPLILQYHDLGWYFGPAALPMRLSGAETERIWTLLSGTNVHLGTFTLEMGIPDERGGIMSKVDWAAATLRPLLTTKEFGCSLRLNTHRLTEHSYTFFFVAVLDGNGFLVERRATTASLWRSECLSVKLFEDGIFMSDRVGRKEHIPWFRKDIINDACQLLCGIHIVSNSQVSLVVGF
eukprot:PhF_6_TR8924/c0_g1_i1/m.14082